MVAIVQRLGLCFVEAKMRVRFPLATQLASECKNTNCNLSKRIYNLLMKNEKIMEAINTLMEEEKVEDILINLYISLINFGIEGCVSADEREDMRRGMKILYEDSIEHKKIIQKIYNKYKNNAI